MEEDEEI